MTIDFTVIYQDICIKNNWQPDADQQSALAAFSKLEAETPDNQGFLSRFRKKQPGLAGVYLYGGVGRGKSFVMDLFFQHTDIGPKWRVHFHEFMQDIHARLHAKRQKGAAADTGAHLTDIAHEISENYRLICFDEMFVDDVADAMLLGRLFSALIKAGVRVVMTSNIPPQDLYKDGLQRERFLPFIDLICAEMSIISFTGTRDYRAGRLKDHRRYLTPLNEENRREAEDIFREAGEGAPIKPQSIENSGRTIVFEQTAGDVLKTDFASLCGAALGAGDYLALARRFSTIILTDVPHLDDKTPNEVKRFITLIDTLYEKKRLVFISAAQAIENLYSGQRHRGAFARTESRLMEMSAPQYPH